MSFFLFLKEKCYLSKLPDNRKVLVQDPSTRIGFQPTPIIQFGQTISSKSVKKGQILTSLKRVNFTGTSMDSKALELILTHCKKLQKIVVDDEIWSTFFSLFEVSDKPGGIANGCLDCVGAIERLILCATFEGTIVISELRSKFKFPAKIEMGFFSTTY